MNTNNYGSREACQRLCDAGIMLKPEKWWCYYNGEWKLYSEDKIPLRDYNYLMQISAFSFYSVWRSMPFGTMLIKVGNCSHAIPINKEVTVINTNPTDALIYLRIWLEERKEGT